MSALFPPGLEQQRFRIEEITELLRHCVQWFSGSFRLSHTAFIQMFHSGISQTTCGSHIQDDTDCGWRAQWIMGMNKTFSSENTFSFSFSWMCSRCWRGVTFYFLLLKQWDVGAAEDQKSGLSVKGMQLGTWFPKSPGYSEIISFSGI